jgi:hypothetical protein
MLHAVKIKAFRGERRAYAAMLVCDQIIFGRALYE